MMILYLGVFGNGFKELLNNFMYWYFIFTYSSENTFGQTMFSKWTYILTFERYGIYINLYIYKNIVTIVFLTVQVIIRAFMLAYTCDFFWILTMWEFY